MKSALHVILGFALLTPVGAIQAAKKEPLRLKPSSSWNLDYAEKRCRLARIFGKDDQRVIAFFDKYGPDEGFRITLSGEPMRVKSSDGEVWLQFGPSEGKQKIFFFSGKSGDNYALFLKSNVRIAGPTDAEQKAAKKKPHNDQTETPPIDPARYTAVRYIDIGKPSGNSVILETGSLSAPFAAMDKCVDNLMADWGIDVEKHKSLTRKATPTSDYRKWVVANDYPLGMLSQGQPAIVEFRLEVGTDGKPTACHIQETTRPKDFDDAVCKSMMRRANFLPALDAEGNALPSFWRKKVTFQIP
jgi:hypothetical protein